MTRLFGPCTTCQHLCVWCERVNSIYFFIHMLWLYVYRGLLIEQLGYLFFEGIYGSSEKLKMEGVGQRENCGRTHS